MSETATRRARRTASLLAAVLLAALTPILTAPAPAVADPSCLSEDQPEVLPGVPSGPGCDDTVPPITTIRTARPQPVGGWIRTTTIEIEFDGEHPDADDDAIGYECQLFNTPNAPTTWTTCASPVRYDDLETNSATPYTFRVRAVDEPDDAHDLTTDPFFPGDADLPDYDQTPAELAFRADATAPETFGFLRTSYYDEAQQGTPMVTASRVEIRLQSNEGDDDQPARYRCRLNGRSIRCGDGLNTLARLKPGWQRFSAASVDPAGNPDRTPFTQRFFVPRNLTKGDVSRSSQGDWRRVRGPGTFAGDYLEASTYGATLAFAARNVREIRLLAAAGPGLGKVEVRVGHGRWTMVDLASRKTERLHVYDVRDQFTGSMNGPIQVRVASRGKPVRVDAVSAR